MLLREWLDEAERLGYPVREGSIGPIPAVLGPLMHAAQVRWQLEQNVHHVLDRPVQEQPYLHELFATDGKTARCVTIADAPLCWVWLEPRWQVRNGEYVPPSATAESAS